MNGLPVWGSWHATLLESLEWYESITSIPLHNENCRQSGKRLERSFSKNTLSNQHISMLALCSTMAKYLSLPWKACLERALSCVFDGGEEAYGIVVVVWPCFYRSCDDQVCFTGSLLVQQRLIRHVAPVLPHVNDIMKSMIVAGGENLRISRPRHQRLKQR